MGSRGTRKEGNMRTIGHEELKQKLDRKDQFRSRTN